MREMGEMDESAELKTEFFCRLVLVVVAVEKEKTNGSALDWRTLARPAAK